MKKIIITPESDPQNPRDNDNLGTMVCFHNRYSLGDSDHNLSSNDFNSFEELSDYLIKERKAVIILPLYLYDHSGLSISTGSFDCRWDSGQIGFIYISREYALKEYGGKIVTKATKEKIINYFKSEVETYDQYLKGDVYGFRIIEEVKYLKGPLANFGDKGIMILDPSNYETITEDEEIDSCYGFYGTDWFKNGMSDYIPEELHELLKTTEITYE